MTINVIINADDFGMTVGVNQAIRELVAKKALVATNVMANMPFAADIEALARDFPELSIGVHINLTEGRPLCDPSDVKTLLNESGEFYPLSAMVKRAMTGRVSIKDCQREISAQVERVMAWTNHHADHWNSHQGLHRFEPFASVSIGVCRKNGIRKMRTHCHQFIAPTGAALNSVASQHGPARVLKESYYKLLSWRCKRYFSMPDGILSMSGGSTLSVLKSLLAMPPLPDGLWEIPCHPATTTEGLAGNAVLQRVEEYTFLNSPIFQEALSTGRIVPRNFS